MDVDTILSTDTVTALLTAQNFAMPAGYLEEDGISYMVSVGDTITDQETLEGLLLFDMGMEGVEPIYLTDVAAVMLTFTLVVRVEGRLNRKRQRMALYLELEDVGAVRPLLELLRAEYGLLEAQVTPPRSGTLPHVGMEILVRVPQPLTPEQNYERFSTLAHVVFVLRNV